MLNYFLYQCELERWCYYVCQVNGVKLVDILFSLLCVYVCEHLVQSSTVTVVGRRLLSVCPKCI